MGALTIGQVAEATGFTPAALRDYDELGVVMPLAFGSEPQTAAARLAAPPIDEQCGGGCACVADDGPDTAGAVELRASASSDVPIACTLQPGLMPARIADWQRVLAAARRWSRTSDNRLRIEFARSVDVAGLARLIDAEQQCCAFFAFALTIDERGTVLEVAAPDGARDLLDVVFGTRGDDDAHARSLKPNERGRSS